MMYIASFDMNTHNAIINHMKYQVALKLKESMLMIGHFMK